MNEYSDKIIANNILVLSQLVVGDKIATTGQQFRIMRFMPSVTRMWYGENRHRNFIDLRRFIQFLTELSIDDIQPFVQHLDKLYYGIRNYYKTYNSNQSVADILDMLEEYYDEYLPAIYDQISKSTEAELCQDNTN